MITQTKFKDLVIFEPKVFTDERGYFFESYNQQSFESEGIIYNWVQDNQSRSSYGVIRGLHFQVGEWEQAKLVRCLHGEILDVAVDLRFDSDTFMKVFSIILSEENKKSVLIPRGFAHGFSVLSENAEFIYKCDNFYNKQNERGIIYNDIDLNIDWMVSSPIVSEKDMIHPTLQKYLLNTK